ncbi:hypothetical protein O1W68_18325 [Rhodococcus sp. H36-A4]|nr:MULTISPECIES: hypothetical protein [unclassified Rhodococcus (in: high G+C Gram-positive bacteria)]MCZ4079907.1 hypothetical protein [Rhodococcus sp. H36-A4]MDJ0361988.1 hypothetical protein [Rhodococcus sp. H29-C3]
MPDFDAQVVAAFGIHSGVSGGRSDSEVLCNAGLPNFIPTWITS